MNLNVIRYKTNLLRHFTVVFLFVLLSLPLFAQEKGDSVFMFRFLTGKNEFYAPGMNNGPELTRMFDCVDRYKDQILNHEVWVHVNGYCSSQKSKTENLSIAKIRSNRVKSELITRKGLREDCFVTRNHSGEGNGVTVSIVVPMEVIEEVQKEEEKIPPVSEEPQDDVPVIPPETEVSEVDEMPESSFDDDMKPSREKVDSDFLLKTNLLGYAILLPNLEAEWMFTKRWSVALEAQRAWWVNRSSHKVYRVATIIPEFRYWPIERAKWHGMYVGIFGGAGLYDLDRDRQHKGHEGSGGMAGVSAGYMWPVSKHLSLEAGLGVGYMRLHDKVYLPADGHFLYQYTKKINYFGPLRLKLSLVWRIPK